MQQTIHWIGDVRKLLCVVFIVVIAGCGSGKPALKTVPVYGAVTLDDKPIAEAVVRFFDVTGKNVPIAGTTDEEGKYKLGVASYDGAAPGSYKVVIEYLTDLQGKPIVAEGGKDSTMLMMEGKAKQILHTNYADYASTQLKADVKEGTDNECNFKLHTDGS